MSAPGGRGDVRRGGLVGWCGMRWCVFSGLSGSFVNNYFFANSSGCALGEPGSMLGQRAEGGFVLAFETALDPKGDVQKTGVIAQRTECAREQRDRGFFMIGFQAVGFTVEHGRLEFPEASLSPVCGGHHSHQVALDGGPGAKSRSKTTSWAASRPGTRGR
jgi:hypothetical protein